MSTNPPTILGFFCGGGGFNCGAGEGVTGSIRVFLSHGQVNHWEMINTNWPRGDARITGGNRLKSSEDWEESQHYHLVLWSLLCPPKEVTQERASEQRRLPSYCSLLFGAVSVAGGSALERNRNCKAQFG